MEAQVTPVPPADTASMPEVLRTDPATFFACAARGGSATGKGSGTNRRGSDTAGEGNQGGSCGAASGRTAGLTSQAGHGRSVHRPQYLRCISCPAGIQMRGRPNHEGTKHHLADPRGSGQKSGLPCRQKTSAKQRRRRCRRSPVLQLPHTGHRCRVCR